MGETNDELGATMEYNTDLFDATTIERMLGHLQSLLQGIASNPQQRLAELPLLTETERRQLLWWNQTAAPYPEDQCIHQLFEAQVEQQPEAVAVTFEAQHLSYRELNRRANKVAHYLQRLGVGPERLVGICMERSIEMVVALLGVLKAGGAYLPLDPSYPTQRLAFMLADAQVQILLAQQPLLERVAPEAAQTICLDADWEAIAQENEQNPSSRVRPENLAYCIYTSGSTGRPKGALLTHRGLCNLAVAQRRAFSIDSRSRILQFASFSFDASVWETFMALANGATLCLTRAAVIASSDELHRLLEQEQITVVTLPPSVLAVLSEEALPALKSVIAAGESCARELVKRWAIGRNFYNAYGPTETTVCAAMELCSESLASHPPIGRPLTNTRLYVLDRALQPVPVGVAGELHIGGLSLARGYLNRPELTAEKFIPDPFATEPGQRLYKTGDLVRYLADGKIEFLGRIDDQVKVRGLRIELGEIESLLKQHPRVRSSVVIAQDGPQRNKRLVAYVVAEGEQILEAGELKSFLRNQLPEYMVPSAFVRLEQLPLLPNGKVDRRALPAPPPGSVDSTYVKPQTPLEELIAGVWQEILGVERVGTEDNFFDLGGHSLLMTRVHSRLQELLGREVPIVEMFRYPTIKALAQYLTQGRHSVLQPDYDRVEKQIEALKRRRQRLRLQTSDLREPTFRV
jgi:amino acid adenylation domain-containing protein